MAEAQLDGRKAWTIASLLFLSQIINYFDKNVMGLAAPSIMRELGLTSEQYGWVASSFFALYALSGVIVGLFIAHRVSSKSLIAALVLIWSLAQLPIVLSPVLGVLIASRVLLGIGEGPSSPTATSAAHEWFSSDNRNMPTALLMIGASLGSVIAAPVLSYVMADHGWRAGFLLCSGLGFAWLILWLLFGASGPRDKTGAPVASRSHPARSVWLDRTILASIVTGFCAYWVVGFTVAWLAPMIRLGMGFDARQTGWVMSAISATGSVLLLLISYASQRMVKAGVPSRVSRAGVNGVCMVLSAAALIGAAMIPAPTLKLALLAAGSALPLLTFTLGPALVSEVAPAEQRSRLLITIYAGITLAGFVSPLVAGWLIGERGETGYNQALLVNGVVVLVGGLAALLFLDPAGTRARLDDVGEVSITR